MAHVFVNVGVGSTGTTSIATAATSLTVGNFIIVFVYYTHASAVVTGVTDTAGNQYFPVPKCFQRVNSSAQEVWFARNTKGNAANVVTAAMSASITFPRMIALQYSGLGANATVVDGAIAHSASASTLTTPTINANGKSNMLVGGLTCGATSTITAGASMTLRGAVVAGDTQNEDRLNLASGAYTVQGNVSTGAVELWLVAAAIADDDAKSQANTPWIPTLLLALRQPFAFLGSPSPIPAVGGGSIVDFATLVAGTSTVVAGLAVQRRFATAIAGTSTVTPALANTRRLATLVVGTSTVTANFKVTRLFAVNVSGVSTVTAALRVQRGLAVVVAGVSAVSGSLRVQRQLQVTVAGTSTVSPSLTTSPIKSLATTIAGTSTVSAGLSVTRRLATVIAGTSAISAVISVARRLQTLVSGSSTVSPNLTLLGATGPVVDDGSKALARRRRYQRWFRRIDV